MGVMVHAFVYDSSILFMKSDKRGPEASGLPWNKIQGKDLLLQ